jgi:hypothetical protein
MRIKHMLQHTTGLGRIQINLNTEGVGGGDSGSGGGNADVNADSNAGVGEGNSGQAIDVAAFWAQPQGEGGSQDSQAPQVDEGQELGNQLVSQIQGFKAEDVFTTEALRQMAEGDLSPLNAGLNKAVQTSMTQMLTMTATMMQRFESHMQGQMDKLVGERIDQSQTSQKDEQLLKTSFSGFDDPALKPVINGVFRQSLRHTNGDRTAAVAMTRNMLQAMGKSGSADFGLERSNPDNDLSEGPSRLVQELLAMRS